MNLLATAILLGLGLLLGHVVTSPHLSNLVPPHAATPHSGVSFASAYQPLATPVKLGATTPQLGAPGVYAVDVDSGVTLYAKAADSPRPIASVTKLATALVIARHYKDSDSITVPPLPTYQPADEIMGLQKGERFTVHDLLAALLINSDDDAADTLGIAASGSQSGFAATMNALMATWGISGTHFSNPSGLTDAGNSVSPRAVAQIAALALQNSTIKQLVATPSATIHDAAGRSFTLTTTDTLLQSGQFQGIKTGYTPAAGECFAGLTQVQGHPVITVVLGSQDRFGDTQRLADWINQTYRWQ